MSGFRGKPGFRWQEATFAFDRSHSCGWHVQRCGCGLGSPRLSRERCTGNDWCKTVTWFSYKLHLVADTCCELPFEFRVEKANSSETGVYQEMVKEILSDEEVRERCVDFVADRGLDSDPLRRQLPENGVTPLIETRQMWRDKPVNSYNSPPKSPQRDKLLLNFQLDFRKGGG